LSSPLLSTILSNVAQLSLHKPIVYTYCLDKAPAGAVFSLMVLARRFVFLFSKKRTIALAIKIVEYTPLTMPTRSASAKSFILPLVKK